MARGLDATRRKKPEETRKPYEYERSYASTIEDLKRHIDSMPFEPDPEIERAYQEALDMKRVKEEEKDEGIYSEPNKQEEETIELENLPNIPEEIIEEPIKEDEGYITVEELIEKYSEGGYTFLGHGTGRRDDSDKTIADSIFENGLRTKDNSLYLTSIGLDVPTPELKALAKETNSEEPTMEKLKDSLDHWPHLDSKDIIIVRVPTKYINTLGDRGDMNSEMFGAFMKEVPTDNKIVNYVDPKFVLGCYDRDKGKIRLNPAFEKELSKETIDNLEEGYKKTVQKTQDRLAAADNYVVTEKEPEVNKDEEEKNEKMADAYRKAKAKLDKIYKTPILEDQITALNNLADEYDFKFDLTLEEVEELSKKVDALYEEAAEIEKADAKIKESKSKTNELAVYQNKLKGQYGIDWFTKVTKEERDKYVELYSTAHNVSKESVQKNIDDSINLWNMNHPKKEESKSDISKEEMVMPKNVDWGKMDNVPKETPVEKAEEAYKWETKNIFRFEEKKALAVLKEVYSKIANATEEQKISFSASYTVLSNICKTTPTSAEEEQRLQTALFNVRDEIYALNDQLSAPGMGGR